MATQRSLGVEARFRAVKSSDLGQRALPADHRQLGGQKGQTETEEGEQKESREALKGSDSPCALLPI